ncbi:MAG TPA: hypothetical protein VIG08_06165 [Gemmatimonadales bacterium]|jgi:hypothetical protein
MAEGKPAGIDRPALERILQRAAELQAGERDIGQALSPDDVLALGREVGIPDRYLQQALLEERTRVDLDPSGPWERVAGPSTVMAQRAVPGTVEKAERSLLGWVEKNELLCVQRQQPGRIVWEPVGGMAAAFRRSTAAIRSLPPFMLSRADTVSATILPLGTERSHVVLSATARKARAELVGGGAAIAAGGVAGTGLLVVLGALLPVAIAVTPVALVAGYATARRFRAALQRLQLGLERALDHLEHGATRPEHQLPGRRPGVFGLLADEVLKSLRS